MQYYNRVNAKADRRIQLFSVKPDIRDKKGIILLTIFFQKIQLYFLETYCLC